MNAAPFEVVILNDYASLTGGSTAVALASALELAARGIPVMLFTCVGPVPPQLRDVPRLTVICLGQEEIARNPNRWQAMVGGIRNGPAARALREVLARKRPDRTIVHAHTWTKALSPFALEAVVAMGFPLVVTLHDYFITCPNGGFFDHSTDKICERTPLSVSCWSCRCDRRNYAHKLWRNVRTVVQNHALRLPAKVAGYVAVSEFSLNLLRPRLPVGAFCRVVPNPVDCPPGPPAPVADNRGFVYVGRFEKEKGASLFAEAVKLTGLEATFVGDGALMPELWAQCPAARFTGWLAAPAIRRELQRARALVFPPLWYETLGLVVIEAAAAGVPVILSDRCAATDLVQDGVNGLHFTHGSALDLAAQMMVLARDDRRAARLGRAAYDWYWANPWTSGRHVSALLRFYRDLTGLGPVPVESTETIYENTGGIRAGG